MGFLTRTSTGIDVGTQGITAAIVAGSSAVASLRGLSSAPLSPDCVRFSLKDNNILSPLVFGETFRDVINRLLLPVKSVSLSLPDAIGRLMIMDVEERFKNHQEGCDLLRWKLKKSLPFEPTDTHLDYQVLQVKESGETCLLVAVASRSVISQYEEILEGCGVVAAKISFSALNLLRPFERLMPQDADAACIWFYGNMLGVLVMVDGIPELLRVKELPGVQRVDGRMFMEVNSSLLVFREKWPERAPRKVFTIASPALMDEFRAMVEDATGAEAVPLEVKRAIVPADAVPADQPSLFPFTGAIGAALRGL